MRMLGTTRKGFRKIHETRKYSIQSILHTPLFFFVPFLDILPNVVVDETASTELIGTQCERALHFSQARLTKPRPSLFSTCRAVFRRTYLSPAIASKRLNHLPLRTWVEECQRFPIGDILQRFDVPLSVSWRGQVECYVRLARVVDCHLAA